MHVPLLDLGAQLSPLRDRILAAVGEVLASGRFVVGPKVRAFEAAVAERLGVAHAIGVSSGTDALVLSLLALGIGPGDLVVTSAYSFLATAGAIVRAGARPIFIDIDPESFLLDPTELERWFAEHRDLVPRVKAILPVHLFGRCSDVERLRSIAGAIPIVEDAAQAFGAPRAGVVGAAGCFSFYPSKTLGALGDGGMIVTSDAAFADRVRTLRNHGVESDGLVHRAGGNFRLDEVQASVLAVLLPELDDWIARRRLNAARYRAELANTAIDLPTDAPGHVYSQFVLRSPDRDRLRAHLSARGIGSEIYYPLPLPAHPAFGAEDLERWPHGAAAAQSNLAIPIHPALHETQLGHVIAALRAFHRP